LNQHKSHLSKRAITEWRFKRLNAQNLISLDELFDVIVEFRPKDLDGTESAVHPIKYHVKLVSQ
jgi:hypothetical protein